MRRVSYKEYKINNLWGAVCSTYEDYFGNRTYVIEIINITIPWREVVDGYRGNNPVECNEQFKMLVAKYKNII